MNNLLKKISELGGFGLLLVLAFIVPAVWTISNYIDFTYMVWKGPPVLIVLLFGVVFILIERFIYNLFKSSQIEKFCKRNKIKYHDTYSPTYDLQTHLKSICSNLGSMEPEVSNYMEGSYNDCKIVSCDASFFTVIHNNRAGFENFPFKPKVRRTYIFMQRGDIGLGHSIYNSFDSICTAVQPRCFSQKFRFLSKQVEHLDMFCEIDDGYVSIVTDSFIQGPTREKLMNFIDEFGKALAKSNKLNVDSAGKKKELDY